jgi:hypothetical protein
VPPCDPWLNVVLLQVSDCDAINDAATHAYIVRQFNGSLQVQAQQAIRGGTDLTCGALYGACTGHCSASARLTLPRPTPGAGAGGDHGTGKI